MKKINIALDGPAGAGKSTIGKKLAEILNYYFIDTGAIYRATTHFFLTKKKDLKNISKDEISKILENINFSTITDNNQLILLCNQEPINQKIYDLEVSNHVSLISSFASVREKLLHFQKTLAQNKGIILDGRDIGTTVLPDAEIKFFITASVQKRAERRWEDFRKKNQNISLEDVKKNITDRDKKDSEREISPLQQAEDAILLDTSNLNTEEAIALILTLIKKRFNIN